MNRNIYRRSIAPHNARVQADGGITSDNVNAAIELMRYFEEQKNDIKHFSFPALTGIKTRTSGLNKFISKLYSLNSPQQEFGAELLLNGSFDNNTNWTEASGWTISNGVASVNTASSVNLTQYSVLTANKWYKLTYTVLNYVSGTVSAYYGGAKWGTIRNTNGIFTEYFLAPVTGALYFNSVAGELSIDNASLVEVLNTDSAQTTSTSQPNLGGNIAPNEILCLENPNGYGGNLSFSPINFTESQPWSITLIANNNSNTTDFSTFLGSLTDNTNIGFGGFDTFMIRSESQIDNYLYVPNFNPLVGKNYIINFQYTGSKLDVRINNVLKGTLNISLPFSFSRLLIGRGAIALKGKLYACIIMSGNRDSISLTEEYNLLRNFIPEMEAVKISAQTITTNNCRMAATPLGTLIPEMQASLNVERITQAVNLTTFSVAGVSTIVDANNFNVTTGGVYKGVMTVGKWFKIYVKGSCTNGRNLIIGNTGDGSCNYNLGNVFDTTYYILWTGNTAMYVKPDGACSVNIQALSVIEIGWTGATELYNAIYSQTSGTAAQKEYESYKAASMWCHFNNDVAPGALYGKLYNWYAIKLMQLDIDTYNAANPTTPWGWRTTLKVDWETLSTTLGGDAVSGGKMKAKFGAFDNQYSNNQSGLSLISAGRRNPTTGNFETGATYYGMWTLDKWTPTAPTNNTTIEFQNAAGYPQIGLPFRFIKT